MTQWPAGDWCDLNRATVQGSGRRSARQAERRRREILQSINWRTLALAAVLQHSSKVDGSLLASELITAIESQNEDIVARLDSLLAELGSDLTKRSQEFMSIQSTADFFFLDEEMINRMAETFDGTEAAIKIVLRCVRETTITSDALDCLFGCEGSDHNDRILKEMIASLPYTDKVSEAVSLQEAARATRREEEKKRRDLQIAARLEQRNEVVNLRESMNLGRDDLSRRHEHNLGRLARALRQPIYLLERSPYDALNITMEFTVAGVSGFTYRVCIKSVPTCTCPDYKTRKGKCKHILFSLVRVLRVPTDTVTFITDEPFASDEVDGWCLDFERRMDFAQDVSHRMELGQEVNDTDMQTAGGIVGELRAAGGGELARVGVTRASPKRRSPRSRRPSVTPSPYEGVTPEPTTPPAVLPRLDGVECPICFEKLNVPAGLHGTLIRNEVPPAEFPIGKKALRFCSVQCGVLVHLDCVQTWISYNSGNQRCILCRANWIGLTVDNYVIHK